MPSARDAVFAGAVNCSGMNFVVDGSAVPSSLPEAMTPLSSTLHVPEYFFGDRASLMMTICFVTFSPGRKLCVLSVNFGYPPIHASVSLLFEMMAYPAEVIGMPSGLK